MNKKRVISLVVAVATVVASMSACGNVGKWAIKDKAEKNEVPVGAYIYSLNSSFYSAAYSVSDTTKSPIGQKMKVDDKEVDAETWIKEQALKSTKQYLVINQLCQEAEISLDDSAKSTISSNATSTYEQSKDAYDKLGIAKESLQYMLESSELNKKLFNSIYGEGGSKAVATSELQKEFEENYVSIKYLPVKLTDSDNKALAQEDKDKIKENLQKYLAQFNDGKTFTEIEKNYNADHENDTIKGVTSISKASSYSDDMKKAIDGLKNGEGTIVTVSSTMYLLFKYDINLEKTYVEDNKSTLLSDLKGDEYQKMIDEKVEAVEIVTNDSAINKYSPAWLDKQ